MTTDHDDTASSPTDHAITELQLHGYRPFQDEPDPRPLPEGRLIAGAVADIFDALIVSLATQDSSLTSMISCGRRSTCSTVPRHGSSASSTAMNSRNGAASASRTVPKSAPSSSNASQPKA